MEIQKKSPTQKIEGWGRFPKYNCKVITPHNEAELLNAILSNNTIARGNGRAYGDSAISIKNTISMRKFNRMLSFCNNSGLLVVEAGVILGDIINTFLPQGWFPSVTPGTKFVTLGGMVAADVHGKNHHKHGSFANFINWIDIVDHSGIIKRCSPSKNNQLFAWTVGGMGLTGIILRIAFRMQAVDSAWVRQTLIPTKNLNESMEVFEKSQNATYSVAWIDCLQRKSNLGRALVMLGEHAKVEELPPDKQAKPYSTPKKLNISMPFNAPSFSLNRMSLRAFNSFYYWSQKKAAKNSLVSWEAYFYPLDQILGWNRIYGRKGFMQFQCVLPLANSRKGLEQLLQEVAKTQQGSFLAVLKKFGAQNTTSNFSFPMEGYTLALDFPVKPSTLKLMTKLDEITIAHGGRFYLAKDSRMTADTLQKSDKRVKKFKTMRKNHNIQSQFASTQSKRLKI